MEILQIDSMTTKGKHTVLFIEDKITTVFVSTLTRDLLRERLLVNTKYGTLHKKLCESSRIALPWFSSVATRISFALFTTAWQTMLREVWLHG